jgi:hypothetical protein
MFCFFRPKNTQKMKIVLLFKIKKLIKNCEKMHKNTPINTLFVSKKHGKQPV